MLQADKLRLLSRTGQSSGSARAKEVPPGQQQDLDNLHRLADMLLEDIRARRELFDMVRSARETAFILNLRALDANPEHPMRWRQTMRLLIPNNHAISDIAKASSVFLMRGRLRLRREVEKVRLTDHSERSY